MTAIVSFYKVNNKGGAWLGKATMDEVSINFPPSMQPLLACVVMLSLVEYYKTSYFWHRNMGPKCSINSLGHSVISDPD